MNAKGRAAAFTGAKCLPWAGHLEGENLACQGNILASGKVAEAMAEASASTKGTLAAAQWERGDRRGQQSAALLVVKEKGGYGGFNDRYIDLQVDNHPRPIEELKRIYELHQLYFAPPKPEELVPFTENSRSSSSLWDTLKARPTGNLPRSSTRAMFNFCGLENLEEHLREDGKFGLRILRCMTGEGAQMKRLTRDQVVYAMDKEARPVIQVRPGGDAFGGNQGLFFPPNPGALRHLRTVVRLLPHQPRHRPHRRGGCLPGGRAGSPDRGDPASRKGVVANCPGWGPWEMYTLSWATARCAALRWSAAPR